MSMDFITELRNTLPIISEGKMMPIKSLPAEYPSWVIRINDKLGVALKYHREDKFYARFSKVHLEYFDELTAGGKTESYLVLYVDKKDIDSSELRGFASICQGFVLPGDDGEARKQILSDPEGWWASWKKIIGNRSSDSKIYSLVGELITYRYLLQNGKKPEWTGSSYKRVDFMTEDISVEVKTTMSRYDSIITIHGQYQLIQDKTPLKLYLCRLEDNNALGESANDIIKDLISLGVEKEPLEDVMEKLGFKSGSKERNQKYKVLELRSYNVDEDFPCINEQSFKGNVIPEGVIHLDYTIDLANLSYEKLL